MLVHPVTRYRRVGYPSSSKANLRLTDAVPRRWKRNTLVISALTGASVLLSTATSANERVIRGKPAASVRFLTESDAREVATAEAKKLGVQFEQKKKTIKLTISMDGGKTTQQVDYVIDEIDSKTGVGFDYVTPEDCKAVYGKDTKIQPAELVKTIKDSLAAVKQTGKVKVLAQSKGTSLSNAQEKLRKDIVSFLKWLKGQGVI